MTFSNRKKEKAELHKMRTQNFDEIDERKKTKRENVDSQPWKEEEGSYTSINDEKNRHFILITNPAIKAGKTSTSFSPPTFILTFLLHSLLVLRSFRKHTFNRSSHTWKIYIL